LRRPCRACISGGVWRAEDDDTWREPGIFIFVWQDTPRVELQDRADQAWLVRDVIGGGDVAIATLRLALPLAEIYA
jgi:hypothetical protein